MLISGYTDRSNVKDLKNARIPRLGKTESTGSEARKGIFYFQTRWRKKHILQNGIYFQEGFLNFRITAKVVKFLTKIETVF